MTLANVTSSPRLIVVSAPSGAGKTTLCARLLQDFPNLRLSISSTTRAPRGQERDGVEYHFLSTPRFESMIARDEFAEWANVHGNYYGTTKATIEQTFARGRSVLLDIDVQGAESLRRAFGDRCVTIFIAPPSMQELEKRLRGRGTEKEETIARRMKNAEDEMREAVKFNITIVNDQFDRAYAELKSFVEKSTGAGGKATAPND